MVQRGKNGDPGQKGEQGNPGKDGKDGTNGTNGVDGQDGNGIASINKTSTSGLIDTYTITYTNGTTTTFQVTNGEGGTTDYSDLDNQPSINGVTLLGNKTAEELGITGSVCNLGMFSDYPQDNRLDLNKLTPGVYLLYRDVSNIYVKATYKDNEILGGYLLRESTLDNIYFLIMRNLITDDLSVGSYVGQFISFRVKDGASSMVKEESTSIQIYSNTIRIDTGTVNTINTVTRDNSQTITGKKTFNTLPESSVVPTTDNQLVNKKYVDDNIGDIETVLTTITTGSGV